jgi:hypothetical protein
MKHLYERLLAKCEKKPVPPEVSMKLERQAQIFGFSKQGTPEFNRCLPKTSTAGEVFIASGGYDLLTVSGMVSDPTKPFKLREHFPAAIRYTGTLPPRQGRHLDVHT